MQKIVRSAAALTLLLAPVGAHAFDLGGLIDKGQLGDVGRAIEPAKGSGLSAIGSNDQISGLKQALAQGAESAVKNLGRENGYLGNDRVRIPLPPALQRADDLLRQVGLSRYGDELRTSMNRAAEAAVPEAKTLLLGAVKSMSVEDAKGILTGGNDAATQYFRKKTENGIAAKFKPIVAKSMKKVGLAQKYDEFASKGAGFGLAGSDASIEDFVTTKAMDGLFLMMADEEKAIRANPLQATGALARKVFSAVR